MTNYYNYFTEIEERFQQRRGTALLLSTLDWALIETWREAGIPLEAALRGIDAAFDGYDARPAKAKTKKINGLAWCAQAVMEAAQELSESSIGSKRPDEDAAEPVDTGFERQRIIAHLEEAAVALENAVGVAAGQPLALAAIALRLREIAEAERAANPAQFVDTEALERTLTVLEEKLLAALSQAAPESLQVDLKEQAAHQLAPYRSRMGVVQIRQVERQFVHKSLLEHYKLPRLSLFYMRHA